MIVVFLYFLTTSVLTSADSHSYHYQSFLSHSTFSPSDKSQFQSPKCQSNDSGNFIDFPTDEKVHSKLTEWWYLLAHVFTEEGTHYQGQLVLEKLSTGDIPTLNNNFILYSPEKNHYLTTSEFKEAEEIDGKFHFKFDESESYNYEGGYYMNATVDEYTMSVDFTPVKSLMLGYEVGRKDYHFGGYIYYYIFPRTEVSGTLKIGDKIHQVTGYGYYEHAYGRIETLFKAGWDWFQMNLEDGTDIIIAMIRLGQYYLWVNDHECNITYYSRNQFKLVVLRTWLSPRTSCQYATAWKLTFDDKEYIIETIRDDMEFLEKRGVKFAAALKISGSSTGRGAMENMGICQN
jgi:predicted secreted hydrolase